MKKINDLISFKGKLAMITGAAQGIGLQIAKRLAEQGADIVIADLNKSQATTAANAIHEQYGVTARGFEVDVANEESINELMSLVKKEFGKLNILVNNAGIYPMLGFLDITKNELDTLFDINIKGAFLLGQRVSSYMIEKDIKGVIINIASTAALKTAGNSAHYVASKHAIAGLTKSEAVELGPKGIRAITIAPTLVDTPGTQKLRENEEVAQKLAAFEQMLPMRRMAKPDDIARAVVFYASDMAEYMTGIVVPIDGGETSL